jgi:tRNA A37 threonylcarbamoyladenosine synthetase subunit TsaC/SUA5/YrdC
MCHANSFALLQPLSILCRSFQDIDTYTMGFPRGNSQGQTNIFRAARQCLPGPVRYVLTHITSVFYDASFLARVGTVLK